VRGLILLFGFVSACGLAIASSSAGSSPPANRPPLPEFRKFGVAPEVRQAMVELGMDVNDGPDAKAQPAVQSGDRVVFLATLTDKEKTSRWVIQLRAVPTPEEVQSKSGPTVKYSSTGNQWTLSHQRSTIEVIVLRPLAKKKTEPQLLLANDDALNAGLWGIAATGVKSKNASASGVIYAPEFRDTPFPEERVQSQRAAALALGITRIEELSHGMAYPAMSEFLGLILSVPQLREMMGRVADVSFFSLLGALNEKLWISTARYVSTMPAERVGLPGTETAYVLPLVVSIGEKPIMLCQLALVPPRPPLQLGAGVVGLAAGHPDGKGPLLTLELIGTSSAK